MPYEAPHLKIFEGDINPVVLVVGDPFRAEIVATKFCDNFKELSFNREYRSYNVEFEGTKLSICSHGIGGPGAMLCFEELIKCGAKVIIRLGTCGSLKPDTIKTGDLVVSTGAAREDGVTQYLVPSGFPAVADINIALALYNTAKSLGIDNCHLGISLSSALFYPGPCEDSTMLKNATAGALSIEMENAPLFAVASVRSIRAAAIGTVDGSPLRWDEGDYDPHGDACKKGKELMFTVGLAVAKQLALGQYGLTNAEVTDLRDENKCLELAYDKWEDDLYHAVTTIRSKVRNFTVDAPNLSGETLRKNALELEHRITRYKSQQKVDFDSITAEEERLGGLLENATKRFSKWQQSVFLAGSPKKYDPAAYQSKSEDPRLEEIRRAIMKIADQVAREGGRTGGWSVADHDAFLKVVNGRQHQWSGTELLRDNEIIDRIVWKLPSQLGREEVEEHIRWWYRHNELEADKRALMEQYKERKDVWQKKRGAAEEADFQAERRAADKRKAAEEAARLDRKRLIEQWKKEKEEAQVREQAAAADRPTTADVTQAEIERRRRNRQRIVAYREEKLRREEEDRKLNRQREAVARRCRSMERTKFEQRNAEVIRRMTRVRSQREVMEIKTERKERKVAWIAAQLSAPYDSVVSRLYETTASQKGRVKAREVEEKEQEELLEREREKS
ncbi:hypothetical protein FOL47_007855, partial [Perkinsus chesapeaki]